MRFTDAVPFQTHWKFAKTRAAGVEKPSFRDEAFEDVTLPHDWQIGNTRDPGMELGWSQGYYPRYEIGWYRKTFDAPEAWRDKSILLIIDGCQRFYDVYLNGERIGGHRYGYLPDAYALDAALRPGETNCLCVRVDNAHGLGDRWYSGAGLYRGVRLLVKDRSHFAPWSLIAQPEIAEDRAAVRVCARIDGPVEPLTAECELKAPDGTLLARESMAVSEGAVSLTLRPETVRCWDVTDPVLYDLELRLKRDDQVIDTAQERIGFREARFDGDLGFLLNGRILKLYGANLHHDGGLIFGAALPEEVLRRRLTTLKSMGCNAIRCSHNPHAEFLYDLCDEMGLVVIDELYDKWCDSQLYFEQLFSEDHMRDLNRNQQQGSCRSDQDLHFVHGLGPVFQIVFKFQSQDHAPARLARETGIECIHIPVFLQNGSAKAEILALREHLNIRADMVRAGFCEDKITAGPERLLAQILDVDAVAVLPAERQVAVRRLSLFLGKADFHLAEGLLRVTGHFQHVPLRQRDAVILVGLIAQPGVGKAVDVPVDILDLFDRLADLLQQSFLPDGKPGQHVLRASFPDDGPDLLQGEAQPLQIPDAVDLVKLAVGIIAVARLLVDIIRSQNIFPVVIAQRLGRYAQKLRGLADRVVGFHGCFLGTGAGLFIARYFSRAWQTWRMCCVTVVQQPPTALAPAAI